MSEKLVMLATECEATNIIYHFLNRKFSVDALVIEDRVSRRKFLRRRARNLGVPTVVGQVLFQALVAPALQQLAAGRIEQIKAEHNLDDSEIDDDAIRRVESVNDPESVDLLCDIDADLVVINGTRIIAGRVLESVDAPFLNMHAGITPAYRGVHGGYWALANGEPHRCGVTVHLLDEGIDTGGVLEQATISPTDDDNFATYPYLQLAEGLPILARQVQEGLTGELIPREASDDDSKLWYHPTLPGYLARRVLRGVG